MNKYIKMTNTTPITADTFNDIWNAIECIDYRLRKLEHTYKIALTIITLLQIILLFVIIF